MYFRTWQIIFHSNLHLAWSLFVKLLCFFYNVSFLYSSVTKQSKVHGSKIYFVVLFPWQSYEIVKNNFPRSSEVAHKLLFKESQDSARSLQRKSGISSVKCKIRLISYNTNIFQATQCLCLSIIFIFNKR